MGGGALLPLIIAEGAASVKTDLDRFERLEAQAAGHLGAGVQEEAGGHVIESPFCFPRFPQSTCPSHFHSPLRSARA